MRRSDAAWNAWPHEMWNRWYRLKWAEISMDAAATTMMVTAPPTRATMADRSEDQSEAAWNSRRLTSRTIRTARANNDSSMSPPASRCKNKVTVSSVTQTRQARR